jgi:Zn-dependent peptidase ImmA (M78 family)/DNA-binding XRE family transcriptional regulator
MANDNVVQFSKAAQFNKAGRLLIPDRLTEARLALRLTQTDLAKKIGLTRQSVSAYERGEKSPEPATMVKIANALEQPISFFTKEQRGTFGRHSVNFFRKFGADTKRRRQACEIYAEWLAQTAYAFDSIANFPKVDIPEFEPKGDDYTRDEIEDIAENVRIHFGLGLGPISNIIRLMESKGVIVCRLKMVGEKVEAFSFWSGSRPFVFLASDKNSAARARFDAAHELAHLCLHKWVGEEEVEDKDRLKIIESQADHFAGAFMLPRKSFPNEVYSPRAESFIDLKARWKSSIGAMIYRCKDLGVFDDRQVTNLYKTISRKNWRTVEPLDRGPNALQFEEPLLLQRVAELVFESGRYKFEEFKADLAISNDVLSQLVGIDFDTEYERSISNFEPTLK